ncbi:MAG: DEAD/DEAH box helicase [Planctomycetaceae bacterium]
MSLSAFHPIVAGWFQSRFAGPTEPQAQGWPAIAAGRHTLIAAPTGSGKTLTAFLAVIDRLLRDSIAGTLTDELRVVYVSPLRALSNDMHRNLEVPLAEIMAHAEQRGVSVSPLRVGLRTGDTPSHKRAALVKNPPHILVTTPESLYLMLTAEKSREILKTVDTLIVDEIHALVRDKRGSHLALSVERLAALTDRPLQRIGLSATQKPIERMAEFLVGVGTPAERRTSTEVEVGWAVPTSNNGMTSQSSLSRDEISAHLAGTAHPTDARSLPPVIVDVGHARELDLAIEVPPSELSAVCSHEQWAEVNQRLVELIQSHRSTLLFVNTRKLAERLTHQLSQLMGEEAVSCHHGSLAVDLRHSTEQRLKSGQLKAVVATASLELGIDVGHIDLVVQIGSPRSIATFLQRIGRSGHALGLIPRGRLFALTRDELLECMALIRAIQARRLDAIPIPEAPLDVLAQQIVAEAASQDWSTNDLFALFRRAYPYRNLERRAFDETIRFLSEGVTSGSGRQLTMLHHDQVNRRIRGRKGARLAAINNGGAIAEVDSARVLLEPEQTVVGSVDEDFAVESNAGDIFLLGNSSWRISRLRGNDLLVTDAHGAPPTIPFWRGEAPGRTLELSEETSQLRREFERRVAESDFTEWLRALEEREQRTDDRDGRPAISDVARSGDRPQQDSADFDHPLIRQLVDEVHCTPFAAFQTLLYVASQRAAIGLVPTQQQIVFERFFDESGGMQLVVHAPFGGRINRAWGLAMRKRFCRSFDFELQASADDDGFILSLGPQHSFPIESLFPMLRTDNVRNLLEQAILAVPMFQVRWRWNVTRALLVARQRNGQKVPPALQRFRSEDLLTSVFPKLTGCQENITGDHELPDHPLVHQTMHDCLHEALDLDGLTDVLSRIESGEITLVPRDSREPSPFAYELLNANPYAFLDGGEIQERRARAVSTRRSLTIDSVSDLGRLDPAAITQVVEEAQPLVRNADELHDVLLSRVLLPVPDAGEVPSSAGPAKTPGDWSEFVNELVNDRRAAVVTIAAERQVWVAAERWPAVRALFPDAVANPPLYAPEGAAEELSAADVRVAATRGWLEVSGPTTEAETAALLGITVDQAAAALEALEGEGIVLRGRFRLDQSGQEWCHRRLLARIHRLTMAGLRREIEPVDVAVYSRFLHHHQGLLGETRRTGTNGLFETVAQLEGIDLPAVCWERDILPARLSGYRGEWLDELCLTGEVAWGRLYPRPRNPEKSRPMASITRIAPVSLFLREDRAWLIAGAAPADDLPSLSGGAQDVYALLQQRGAMFATDLLSALPFLPTQLDDALGELVVRGLITSDGIAGLRSLVRVNSSGDTPEDAKRRGGRVVRRRRAAGFSGRWSAWPTPAAPRDDSRLLRRETAEHWAWLLLRRWGVVFKDLLRRESGAPTWFDLLQVYRKLEARGELRGGRFVRGVAGEQFALSETIRELRQLRDAPPENAITVLSGADPLNLTGILTAGARLPVTSGNRLALIDGVPVAARRSGQLVWLAECPADLQGPLLQKLGAATKVAEPAPSRSREQRPRGPASLWRRFPR